MSFDVGVNDNVLITPALPYGRSYHVMGVVSSEYGSRKHNTIGDFILMHYTIDSILTPS